MADYGHTDHTHVLHGSQQEIRASIGRAEPPPRITGIGAPKAPLKPKFKVAQGGFQISDPVETPRPVGTPSPYESPTFRRGAIPTPAAPATFKRPPSPTDSAAPVVSKVAAAVANALPQKPKSNKAI